MKIFKNKYLIWTIIFTMGIIFPHLDIFIVLIVFSLFTIIPLLIGYTIHFLILFIKSFKQNDIPKRIRALNGFVYIIIIVATPNLSLNFAESYTEYKGQRTIEKISEFQSKNNRLPENMEELNLKSGLFQFNYHKFYGDYYELSYKPSGMLERVYNNRNKRWETLGFLN